jgi:hypothetical protein
MYLQVLDFTLCWFKVFARHSFQLYMMGESMENQNIDEEFYDGSYKATKKNDSSH